MKFSLVIVFICSFILNLNAQKKEEALNINRPTICECARLSIDNDSLRDACAQKFNYNLLSTYERQKIESELSACYHPDVCDCIEKQDTDPFLKTVCDTLFDEAKMTEDELSTYTSDKSLCDIKPIQKPSLKYICNCVNSNQPCKDLWDITHLSESERIQFIRDISNCISHKDDPLFTLTPCDCINAPKDDLKLKQICIEKFDLNTFSLDDLKLYQSQLSNCDEKVHIEDVGFLCDCLNSIKHGEGISPDCETAIDNLNQKYSDPNSPEAKKIFQKLMDCLR